MANNGRYYIKKSKYMLYSAIEICCKCKLLLNISTNTTLNLLLVCNHIQIIFSTMATVRIKAFQQFTLSLCSPCQHFSPLIFSTLVLHASYDSKSCIWPANYHHTIAIVLQLNSFAVLSIQKCLALCGMKTQDTSIRCASHMQG